MPPLSPAAFSERIANFTSLAYEIPDDFFRFYKTCDGIQFGTNARTIRFRAPSQVNPIPYPELEPASKLPYTQMERERIALGKKDPAYAGSPWVVICDLPDQGHVALELGQTREHEFNPDNENRRMELFHEWLQLPAFNRVCHLDRSGRGTIFATSLAEFVTAAIEANGSPDCIKHLKSRGTKASLSLPEGPPQQEQKKKKRWWPF